MLSKQATFTGTQVAYFIVCPTKLWLFSKYLQQEKESDLVQLGALIQKMTYRNSKKDVMIDQKISIDFIRKKDKLILHEIKKSDKLEKAHIYQMLYYLYYLKKLKGVEAEGEIDYPNKRKVVKVLLTEEKEKKIEEILREIKKITGLKLPPKPEKKKYCKKCSYYEFCFS